MSDVGRTLLINDELNFIIFFLKNEFDTKNLFLVIRIKNIIYQEY